MRRIFITGGTGFFGKSILDYRLLHPDWKGAQAEWIILSRAPERFAAEYPQLANQAGISYVGGDVRDFAFPAGHFDAIIHAATSAVTTLSDEEMTSVILDGVRHVADFAKAADCRTVLFTSSGAVYGPRTEPAAESDTCNPATAYGKGKLAAEQMLIDSGVNVKIARCFAFVGPYLNRKIHYAIGNFIRDCLDGQPIIINGDGTDPALLKEEGVLACESFVPLTGIDEENVMLSLHVKSISTAKLITKISRSGFSEVISKLDLGSVVYPRYVTSEAIIAYVRARSAAKDSNIETLYHMFDSRAEAIEFKVTNESDLTGKELRDLKLKDNLLISFIIHDGKTIIPTGNDKISVGDSVMVVTTHLGFTDITNILK